MFPELDCGICYWSYDAGRRCPRELRCKHSFCESCLEVLSRTRGPDEASLEADRVIVCPLCRQTTSISGVRRLPVNESVLERLLIAGVLGEEQAPIPASPTEENESLMGSRGDGNIKRFWKKSWRRISKMSSRRTGGETCITAADMRNLATMSCYMF